MKHEHFLKQISLQKKKALFAFVTLAAVFAITGASHRLRMAVSGEAPRGDFDASRSLIFGNSDINNNYPSNDIGVTGLSYTTTNTFSDGSGNYLTWYNLTDVNHETHLVTQKFNSSGVPLWGDGVVVDSASRYEVSFFTDGAGGAIFVWQNNGIFAQRVDSTGTVVFPSPVALAVSGDCSTNESHFGILNNLEEFALPDGAGGAFAIWTGSNDTRCLQRINGSGTLMWGDGAINPTGDSLPYLANDGANGVWVGYSNNNEIQHYDSSGALVTGCPVSLGSGDLLFILPDGVGGVVVASNFSTPKVHRIDSSCAVDPAWPVGGQQLSTHYSWRAFNMTLFGSQVMATWRDGTPAGINTVPQSLKASLINLADGSLAWGGEATIVTAQGTGPGYSDVITPVASGSDFIFTAVKSMGQDTPNGGAILVKLNGTTGAQIFQTPILGNNDLPMTTVSDGTNGLILTYHREYDAVFAQRYDSTGNAVWPALNRVSAAVPGSASPFRHYAVSQPGKAVMNAAGQKAVFWQTYSQYYYSDTAAQSVLYMKLTDLAGDPLGGGDGVFVVDQADGLYGAVSWIDAAADETGFYLLANHYSGEQQYITLRKFDLNGNPLWGVDGIHLVLDWGTTSMMRIALDGAGGVFTSYNGDGFRILHVDSLGNFVWNGAAGVKISRSGSYFKVFMEEDGVGGLYVAWSAEGNVRFIHLDNAGVIDPSFPVDVAGPTIGSGPNSMVYGLVADGGGNHYISYVQNYNTQYLQKMTDSGVRVWPNGGKAINRDPNFNNAVALASAISIGDRGVIISWYSPTERLIQSFDSNGEKRWGPVYTTHLVSSLSGGEGSIEVNSTTGFPSFGTIKIGENIVRYNGTDATHFYSTEGVLAAESGAVVVGMPGLRVSDKQGIGNDLPWPFVVTDDSGGGAMIAYTDYMEDWSSFGTKVAYVDRNGQTSFGGGRYLNTSTPMYGNITLAKNVEKNFFAWVAQPQGAQGGYLYCQQYPMPSQPHATAPEVPHTPVLETPPGQTSPVVIGVNSTTYYFQNPGTATVFKLVEIMSDGSKRIVAVSDDPTITSIAEPSLVPNTKYGNRVVIMGNDRGDGPMSPFYPTFVTLQENPPSVKAGLSPDKKLVTVVALGDLPNLGEGLSGIKFTDLQSGKTSDWIKTAAWVGTDLKVGEKYQIEVQVRNSAGVVSPSVIFEVTPAATLQPNVRLTKTVDIFKAALAAPTQTVPNPSFPSSGPYLRDDGQISVTTPLQVSDANTIQNTLDSFLIKPVTGESTSINMQKDRAVLRYRITAKNEGSVAAYDTVIVDHIPSTLIYQPESVRFGERAMTDAPDDDLAVYDSSTETLTVKIDKIEPGETQYFTFDSVLTVRPDAAIKNKATATYSDGQ